MPHSVGAHSPTNIARRSALPRSAWSTVFARIHRLTHSATDPTDSAWTWLSRTPERWSVLMITEAGGSVTNYDGSLLSIYKPPICASNGLIHNEMLAVLS